MTFDKSQVGFGETNENLTVQWYVRVNVTNTSNAPINIANVNITELQGVNKMNKNTDADGFTTWNIVTEMVMYNSTHITHNNHTVVVSKAGYITNTTSFNITSTTTLDVPLRVNTIPTITKPYIDPKNPTAATTTLNCSFTANDSEQNTLTYEFYWYNGTTLYNNTNVSSVGTGNNYTHNITVDLSRGEIWNCTVRVYDGYNYSAWDSNNVTVLNAVPTTPTPTINSTDGSNDADQDLNCFDTISDPDGDKMNVTVRWYVDGTMYLEVHYTNSTNGYLSGSYFNASLGSEHTDSNQNWSCSLQLFDSVDYSEWGNSSNLTIGTNIDLYTTSNYIMFSDNAPIEFSNVTINVTVYNNGSQNANGLIIQFFDGDTDSGGTQIGGDVTTNLAANTNETFNTTWNATQGTHNIYVLIDPPYGGGSFSEQNENNNKANKTIIISVWQIYYGWINGTIYLSNNQNVSVLQWWDQTVEGNVFVTDSDSDGGISFTSLQAIFRNTTNSTNSNTEDDFENIDVALGIENFTGNVNETFSSGGVPRNTLSWKVYNEFVNNVAYDNSTNTSSFITGILWDTSDSSNDYYDLTDEEDIVFVTKINESQTGQYGTYDYEIKIPANLKYYKGSTNTVDFYYEIT
jgi:hypothetical protein